MNSDNKRSLLLVSVFYTIPNLLGFVGVLWLGFLVVDAKPLLLAFSTAEVSLVFLVVVFSIVFVYFVANLGGRRFRVHDRSRPSRLLGVLIFMLQLAYVLNILFTGYGAAGSKASFSDPVSVLFSYIPVDAIFLIYYGYARKGGAPVANMSLYLVSSLLRGWFGVFIIIFLLESYYLLASGARRALVLLTVAALLVLAFAPALLALKETVRGSQPVEQDRLLTYFLVLNRLQLFTNTVLVAQTASSIEVDIDNGRVMPWYVDSPIGARISGNRPSELSIQKYLTYQNLIDPRLLEEYPDDLSWYTNVGISAWLFLLKWYEIPLYLAYVAMLIWTPYFVLSKFAPSSAVTPVLHLFSFAYVFHGWVDPQFKLIAAACIYGLLHRVLRSGRS